MGTSLFSTTSLVQTPFIKVTIGNYTFGVYEKNAQGYKKYPNYIQGLEITKINGEVNKYSLSISYPINEFCDPNYFEKVFSSVSLSRKIVFTYGDMSLPQFVYKNEEAIITKVTSDFELESSIINYKVEAVSQAKLTSTGNYTFYGRTAKPSVVIKELLKQNNTYGLLDLFTGMRNTSLLNNLIPGDDLAVKLDQKTNISVLDYLQYLVDSMTPNTGAKTCLYILTFIDDTTDTYGGSYFKIVKTDTAKQHPEAYELDIGYPGANCVKDFRVDNDENYSIYYDYQNKLHPQEYVSRINANGDYEEVYAPNISSGTNSHSTQESDKSWWKKVTEYPVKVGLTIKGLLRPAVLMSYVRLNIILYGKKHINSGLYIITKQVDKIDSNGYSTTLNLIRVASDDNVI